MANLRKARLIMVTGQNNNKYYNMDENPDGTVSIEFGRVGASCQRRTISASQFESQKRSKVKKGYKDVSDLVMEVVHDAVAFKQLTDNVIQQLLDKLQAYQHRQVETHYRVGAGSVTQKQVDEAQSILDKMAGFPSPALGDYNDMLIELFAVIPRKMSHVRDHLLNTPDNPTWEVVKECINKKLSEEQDLLDTMASQVVQANLAKDNTDDSRTMLEAMGISVEQATAEDCDLIKKQLGELGSKFRAAFRVVNHRTQKMFDTHVANAANKKTELFFHGSRNENWLSILKSGLVLRPTNAVVTGKMFGYGTYFADKAMKSYGYTSGRGSYWARGSASEAIMALYDVHVGNQKVLVSSDSGLNRSRLPKEFDSVFAKAGHSLRNNEFIVYEEEQSTIKYLVLLDG